MRAGKEKQSTDEKRRGHQSSAEEGLEAGEEDESETLKLKQEIKQKYKQQYRRKYNRNTNYISKTPSNTKLGHNCKGSRTGQKEKMSHFEVTTDLTGCCDDNYG